MTELWHRVPRLLLFVVALLIAGAGVAGHVLAAEWPAEWRFLLVENLWPITGSPVPASVGEAGDGALLVLLYWPITRTFDDGSTSEMPRTRLVRVSVNGSRAFVPPFGELVPGSREARFGIDDEILPLPDGSIVFSGGSTIQVWRRDGSITRVAGIDRSGFSGDGGPAIAAELCCVSGLSRRANGSILFGDGSRVRQIAPDGTITTVAGTGESAFGGDGGPATAAQLSAGDVLATEDGGFLIADTFNGRIRRIGPDGLISTVAGSGVKDPTSGATNYSSGDGGPASAAALAWPQDVGQLPDGTLVIAEPQRIRQVSADGTIDTIFQVPQARPNRPADYHGRSGDSIEALAVTEEGGIAVIVSGLRLRAYYLVPPQTRRVLVGLRDARTSQRRVKVAVDTTTRGKLRLEVRRRGRVVASAARHVEAGRQAIAVNGRFAPAYHDVRVTLRAKRGAGHRHQVRLFTSRTLPERLAVPTLDEPRCQRINRRRIDCEARYDIVNPRDPDGATLACRYTTAYKLFPSGLLFSRPYPRRRGCRRKPIQFDRSPKWSAPWHPWPPY